MYVCTSFFFGDIYLVCGKSMTATPRIWPISRSENKWVPIDSETKS